MEYHINAKELLAAKFALKTFVKVPDAHVKLLSDNTANVPGTNKMYSNKFDLFHSIISGIWTWTKEQKIWITASYIPGTENYDADTESRKSKPKQNGCLTKKLLQKLFQSFNFKQR